MPVWLDRLLHSSLRILFIRSIESKEHIFGEDTRLIISSTSVLVQFTMPQREGRCLFTTAARSSTT